MVGRFSFDKMGRIIAIDYGSKRCGLAATDPERIIASGVATVETPRLLDYLRNYCSKEAVDTFLIGEPRHMDNTPSDVARLIEPFIENLRNTFPDIEIARIDERFTSKLAFQAMIDGGLGMKRRRDKALIDTVSATIMLQDYMRQISNKRE